jgi:hypothetical protein
MREKGGDMDSFDQQGKDHTIPAGRKFWRESDPDREEEWKFMNMR